MFTPEQIKAMQSKIKYGADFPDFTSQVDRATKGNKYRG